MSIWEKWVRRPQGLWVRRAVFQIHLWAGIGLALYVFLICITGSAAVFNSELYTAFLPKPKIVAVVGPRLTLAELRAAAQRAYPTARVTRVFQSKDPREATVVSMQRNGKRDQRFFDPYTGKDVATAQPFLLRMVGWISQLHIDLLLGYTGLVINGVGGFLSALLCLTGLVVWWPGIQSWRKSLVVRRNSNFKRLNWDLHSAVGFWMFALIFMWTITGAYMVFPRPFDATIGFFASPKGHKINFFEMIHSLHVGDFAGWPIKALWVALGLAPPLLVVTGFLMWWHRVVGPRLARGPLAQPSVVEATSPRADRVAAGTVQEAHR